MFSFSEYFSPAKFLIWAKYRSQVRLKSVVSYISVSSSSNYKSAINLQKFLLSKGLCLRHPCFCVYGDYLQRQTTEPFQIRRFLPFLRVYFFPRNQSEGLTTPSPSNDKSPATIAACWQLHARYPLFDNKGGDFKRKYHTELSQRKLFIKKELYIVRVLFIKDWSSLDG